MKFRYTILFLTLFAITANRTAIAQDATAVWVNEVKTPVYFALFVEDMAKSIAWYSAVFGMRELERSEADDGVWKIVNLMNEHLFVELIRDDRVRDLGRSQGFFKVGFYVPDIEAVADRIFRITGERPRIVDSAPHHIRILQLKDPDENTIQLHAHLEN